MLEIAGIDAAYGHAVVLHDVSLDLEEGQMAFVIGRNGAGKTTLLRTIMGLLKPRKGSIRYLGSDVTGALPEDLYRKGFRYVPQDKRVFGDLTVRENIEIAAYSSREPLRLALDKVMSIYPKLEKFLDMKAGKLSGGQRQILLVGQALVGDPKLLLIDEPTQGLAAVVVDDIARILTGLRGRVSAIVVEQNLPLMRRLADKVFALKEGKISMALSGEADIAGTQSFDQFM
ncbi:MAG: ATP-binding cassette domain-containing protein [Firmicutes bacterium]|jgi:ABC-type branched-subunit amino acid transport system ATPase component|nr:ATP-binding cassette domain-containing protein [Bacillota bacterium]MDH7494739.1 ATP-binding cassette domain-containing protein [Bacillota bacterium]